MGRTFGKWIGMVVVTTMLCLTGLVMSDEAQAQRFVDNGNGTVTDTQTGLMSLTDWLGFRWLGRGWTNRPATKKGSGQPTGTLDFAW
ncbi:hypothetical protein [Desulfonatronum thiodismutans]|uniref:hypothetical protein n=1 Tax=Desulfonatronum thiodismutans TaxID=159290 RepID=UPI0004ABE54E|nr:hypothetical protein [Desulfonatronum thiodismutans]